VIHISTTTATDPSITLAQARQARQRLLSHIGRIEQAIALDNTSPKRQFISPATRAAVFALYYDHMRQTIEAQGTRNFPTYNQQRLYGQLVMAITVDTQGRVLGTRVLKTASQGALNQRAKALVAGMRFEPFSASLAAQASELVVVTQFDFLRDRTLSTQLSAPHSSATTPKP
jgi:protein TonB